MTEQEIRALFSGEQYILDNKNDYHPGDVQRARHYIRAMERIIKETGE